MNIHECESMARDQGFDRCLFIGHFPSGPKRCRWLDAYMGGFLVEGVKGVLHVSDVEKYFPDLECTAFEAVSAEEADRRFPVAAATRKG